MSHCTQTYLHLGNVGSNHKVKVQLTSIIKSLINGHNHRHVSLNLTPAYTSALHHTKISLRHSCTSNRECFYNKLCLLQSGSTIKKTIDWYPVRFYARGPHHILQNNDYSHRVNLFHNDSSEKMSSELFEHESSHPSAVDEYVEGNTDSGVVMEENNSKVPMIPRKQASDLPLSELSRYTSNIAAYVNRSETLQKMVVLGVNLSKVQKFDGMASLLLRSDFDRDIAPYVRFLVQVGVPPEKLGLVLTVNPHILTEDLQDLEERVGYLVHKNFSLASVASMYTNAPVTMLMSPKHMDLKLAFLQQTFDLTSAELRALVVNCPKILPYKKDIIALRKTTLKEFLVFSEKEMKTVLLKCPQVYMTSHSQLITIYDYIHNTMGIPHDLIAGCPNVLTSQLHLVSGRHLFLKHLHRAQYDPCLENFVSLKALVSARDEEFCLKVAKTSYQEFLDFTKTL